MLTPEEQHLFEQLGRDPRWRAWLDKEDAHQIQILKKNAVSEQIYRAQGATGLIDKLRTQSGIK